MSGAFHRAFGAVENWTEKAITQGWLSEKAATRLRQIETQKAEELFTASGERPLLVAFFGGTGVGKSSLLNRLAGEALARTGVERPTSREVTLYVHRDFQLRALPAALPHDNTVIAYHDDDQRRMLAWLDLPDIDSTESAHRQLVEQWLPYCDWLIYVVTPERYHDDIGWRFAQQRQQHHSWLFVMNHWDQGHELQIEDFRKRLLHEAFVDPVILRTDCSGEGREDDFVLLEQTINKAIRQYGLRFLQTQGDRAKLAELRQQCDKLLALMGDTTQWQAFNTRWQDTGQTQLALLREELQNNARAIGQKLVIREASRASFRLPFLRRNETNELPPTPPATQLADEVWDQRSQAYISDLALALEQVPMQLQLPRQAVGIALQQWQSGAHDSVSRAFLQQIDAALLTPGSRLQRGLYHLMRTLGWVLPLGAASWAGWHLVSQFYASTKGEGDFLGADFAIHSLLLISLAWLLPWLLQSRLKPSLANAVRLGMLKGIESGKQGLLESLDALKNTLTTQRVSLVAELQQIRDGIEGKGEA